MDVTLLEEIGLTAGETKVYLALLRLGATKTGRLSKESNVSSSKVYKILDRLIKKGLAGSVTKGKTKYFTAMEPKRILEYLDNKEKELNDKKKQVEELLPMLEAEQKEGGRTDAVVFEGFKAVTNFIRSIVDDLQSGEEYYVIGAGYGEAYGTEVKGLRAFFHQHHIRRAKKGIKVKMLANFNIKGNIETTTSTNSTIRYLPQYLITNMSIFFFHDKSFIVLWTKSPTGFLIYGEEAVKSFRSYFDVFWKIAEE